MEEVYVEEGRGVFREWKRCMKRREEVYEEEGRGV